MKCEVCQGRKFIEKEHGLIQIECKACKGTGEVPDKISEPRKGQYYCTKCGKCHYEKTKIGRRHLKYQLKEGIEALIIPYQAGQSDEAYKEMVKNARELVNMSEGEDDSNSRARQVDPNIGGGDTC